MVKVSEETKQVLEYLKTEILSGKCLALRNSSDRAWNDSIDRAYRIIVQYSKGGGLFQIKEE